MEEGVLEGSWRSKDVIGWHFDRNERSSGVGVGIGVVEGDSGRILVISWVGIRIRMFWKLGGIRICFRFGGEKLFWF